MHLTVLPGSAVRNRADRRGPPRRPTSPRTSTRRARLPGDHPGSHLARPRRGPAGRDAAGRSRDQVLARWCTPDDLRAAARPPAGRSRVGQGAGGAAGRRSAVGVADGVGAPLARARPAGTARVRCCSTSVARRRRTVSAAGPTSPGRPRVGCCVEFDGDLHRDRAVFVADLRRQNRLVAAGWTVLRYTSARRPRPRRSTSSQRRSAAAPGW